LAAKIDISTNFLADIEAGNTWVSSQTLVKLVKAFEIEVYELLKPEKSDNSGDNQGEDGQMNALIDRFSRDLTVVLRFFNGIFVEHVKKEYK
jgi:transcriptional regulator with XRE-family HTH domain